jgi:hypothetical protein
MKKVLIALAVVGLFGGALAATGVVFAQSATPNGPANQGYGAGRIGGRGMMAGWAGNGAQDPGWMHDDLVSYMAGKLGLSVDELNQKLSSGQTMAQIAQEKGFTLEQFQAMFLEARQTALNNAVAEGVITQAQADWMSQRMAQMNGYGLGAGTCWGANGASGGPGMMGRGRWASSAAD